MISKCLARSICSVIALVFVGACARVPGAAPPSVAVSHRLPTIFHIARGLADQLEVNLSEESFVGKRLVVTTIADLDRLDHSATLGRLISEALGIELVKKGCELEELRAGRAILMGKGTGELVLSRDPGLLPPEAGVDLILSGTYAVTGPSVAVSLRLFEASSRRVVSVAAAEVAMTPVIKKLLEDPHGPEPTSRDRLL